MESRVRAEGEGRGGTEGDGEGAPGSSAAKDRAGGEGEASVADDDGAGGERGGDVGGQDASRAGGVGEVAGGVGVYRRAVRDDARRGGGGVRARERRRATRPRNARASRRADARVVVAPRVSDQLGGEERFQEARPAVARVQRGRRRASRPRARRERRHEQRRQDRPRPSRARRRRPPAEGVTRHPAHQNLARPGARARAHVEKHSCPPNNGQHDIPFPVITFAAGDAVPPIEWRLRRPRRQVHVPRV